MSNLAIPLFRLGDDDPVIATVKAQLARLDIRVGDSDSRLFDDTFELAIREFQQWRGILCDGVLGPETFDQIELARHRLGDRVLRYDPSHLQAGDDVMALQKRLSRLGIYTEQIDYFFGAKTDAALREVQQDLGIVSDGIAGPTTFQALDAVSRGTDTGDLFALRERVRKAAEGTSLAGRVFVIEFGTSQRDFNTSLSEPTRERERQLSGDIARRVEGRLTACGAAAITAGPDAALRLGDELAASLIVSINFDFNDSSAPSGAATYYFGHVDDPSVRSPIGRLAADLIDKELVARNDLQDGRAHAKTWGTLRAMRTPKVIVVAGYLTNPYDSAILSRPETRDSIAESIVVALQRVYLSREQDPETGSLSLADITNQFAD